MNTQGPRSKKSQFKESKPQKLRPGFTTGAAAAAATRGGLIFLLTGKVPERVFVPFIGGGGVFVAIDACIPVENGAQCTVIKDAGDDPDVTHNALIGVRLYFKDAVGVTITGGEGVGRVTQPGLDLPVGEAAINPGPREMIRGAVADVYNDLGRERDQGVAVEVFVPQGERLAQKTLNARLGILGGISILGTTGLVRPMSHEAYIATIESCLSVARARGLSRVFFTTGRRSERFAQGIWPGDPDPAFIQIGDFFKVALEAGADFEEIILAVFFGKAVKMAQGFAHTHAAKSSLCMEKLAAWVEDAIGEPGIKDRGHGPGSFPVGSQMISQIRSANTARHAFTLLGDHLPVVAARVGEKMVASARAFLPPGSRAKIRGVIMDFKGGIVFDSGRKTHD